MCTRDLILDCGRKIRLDSMVRERTYLWLLEGIPRIWINDQHLQAFIGRGWKFIGRGSPEIPYVLLPYKVQHWPNQEWVWSRRKTRYPEVGTLDPEHSSIVSQKEVMPPISTMALFSSAPKVDGDPNAHLSYLAVVWFQDDDSVLIEDRLLKLLQKIPWDTYAMDWEL